MKKSTLLLNNISLKPYQIHKFRGFIGNLFRDHDLTHNHDLETGKPIYRYPLVQFKSLNGVPAIIAITDRAVDLFSKIFMGLDKIVIEGRTIPVFEKDLKVEDVVFGFSDEFCMYQFMTPWIALNQKNHRTYQKMGRVSERKGLLKRTLIGNILSMSKYLGYRLEPDQRIEAEIQTREKIVTLKSKPMIGFEGVFKANFLIPDYLGIGKSVSRGFGVLERKREMA